MYDHLSVRDPRISMYDRVSVRGPDVEVSSEIGALAPIERLVYLYAGSWVWSLGVRGRLEFSPRIRGSKAPDRRKFQGIWVPGPSTGSRRSKCLIMTHSQPRTPDLDPV